MKSTKNKSGAALLKALPFIALLALSACATEPIDIDTLPEADEIPPGPGIIERQTGKKLEIAF